MKWSNLWKVLKVIADHAPEIIAVVGALKDKDAKDAAPAAPPVAPTR